MADTDIEWTKQFARGAVRDGLARIIDEATPGLTARLATDPAAYTQLLAISEMVAQEADELVREAAISARHAGLTWERIGDSVGMSRQAAQQRFGPKGEVEQVGAPNPVTNDLAVAGAPGALADAATQHLLPPIGTQAHISEASDSGLMMLSRAGRHGWRAISVSPGGIFTIQFDNRQWQVVTTTGKEPAGLGWHRIGRYGFTVYWTQPTHIPVVPGAPDPKSFKSQKRLDRELARRGVAGAGSAGAGLVMGIPITSTRSGAAVADGIATIADSIAEWFE